MSSAPEPGIIGVFKGMGDLLWAVPVIRAEVDRCKAVHLLIFPGPALLEFCSLIDFGPNAQNLHLHPVPTSLGELPAFVARVRTLAPAYIWISPHSPAADSSWRVPLFLRLLQLLFWHRATLVGATTEKLSTLFHRRFPLDRTLPLPLREWTAYRQFRADTALPVIPSRPRFIPAITDKRNTPPRYDLVIHPGATAPNRVWPADKYPTLLASLPPHWRLAVVGLPHDVAVIQAHLPPEISARCNFISGTLTESIQALASARLLLVMNSGTMHFAEVLGVPTIAIFGQQDPSQVIGEGCITPIYQHSVPCQPCARATCSQPQVYCLTNLDSRTVAQRLLDLESTVPPHATTLTQIQQHSL